MRQKNDQTLAVLIDADNISAVHVKGMLNEIAKFGIPSIKRIYGDWTNRHVSGWKTPLLEHAITPIQQYSYTVGKNATDAAMIIDAMDILHKDQVDGFCLVSSDSDFTRLATRIRESGKMVIGIGEKKTPQPFIVACDKFIYLEIISGNNEDEKSDDIQTENSGKSEVEKIDRKFISLLKSTVKDVADEDDWAALSAVGALLNKKQPDFDPRNYGFLKLSWLLKSMKKHFLIDERMSDKAHIKHVYIKIK